MLAPQAAPQAAALINGAPHYFSHPNYANSPLPVVTAGALSDFGNPLVDRTYSSDNASNVFVTLPIALPDGLVQSFQTWNQVAAGGSPASAGLNFHAYVLRPTGNPNEYTVFFDSGQLTVPPLADPTVSELATFPVANLAVQAGDMLAFYGRGIPLDIGAGNDEVYYPSPAGPTQGSTITLGAGGFPVLAQARTYSFAAGVFDTSVATINGGIRKFVDRLAGLGPSGVNNLGQYISVAVPDTTTYPGADYYEIAVVQFQEQMHSDLPATTHRGYVQLETSEVQGRHYNLGSGHFGVDAPHTSGSRPPTRALHIRRVSVCNPCRIWATPMIQPMA